MISHYEAHSWEYCHVGVERPDRMAYSARSLEREDNIIDYCYRFQNPIELELNLAVNIESEGVRFVGEKCLYDFTDKVIFFYFMCTFTIY